MPEERLNSEVLAGDPDWSVHQLPDEIKKYHQEYPRTVRDIGSVWGKPAYPDGYQPESRRVYYGDYSSRGSAISVYNGQIDRIDPDANKDSPVTKVLVDGDWAYIEIGGRVFIDRLNGIEFPTAIASPASVVEAIVRQRREGDEE